jgi:hypothetical protein
MVRFIVFIIVLFVYFRCAGYSEAQNGSGWILRCGSLLEITLHAVHAKTQAEEIRRRMLSLSLRTKVRSVLARVHSTLKR